MRLVSENRLYGLAALILTGIFLFYYTVWVIVLPFVSDPYRTIVSSFFPPVSLALAIPAGIGSFLSILLLSRAWVLVCQDRQREKRELEEERRR